jgi:polyhydroxyalkanoate synthesis regulator phasin
VTARKRGEQKIQDQLDELLRWQDVMMNREDRVQALKSEINELLRQRGLPPRYGSTGQT